MYDKEDSNYKGDYFKSPFFYALLAFVVGVMLGRFINFPINDESQPVETDNTISSDTFTVAPEDKIEKNTKIRKAFVVSETGTVLRGDRYNAFIYLAEIDTSLNYRVVIKGRPLEHNEYSFVCATNGKYDYEGAIEVVESDSTISEYPFTGSYTVVEPLVNITSDVLLAGKDNPISVSSQGFPTDNIILTCTNSTVRKLSGSRYIIRPAKPGTSCRVSVSGKLENGKIVFLGRRDFIVK